MKRATLVLLAFIALAPGLVAAKSRLPHFPAPVLIAEAKTAPLKLIDALETYCDTDTPIADWLTRLTARETRSIAWTAGKCELVNDLNPLDAGGNYCVQATLRLRRPKSSEDAPEIEIYIDDPKAGKPGPVYAFRAMFDSPDGPDYIRFRKDFEAEWRDRFQDTPPPPCTDDR
jgi:hypothetical protein